MVSSVCSRDGLGDTLACCSPEGIPPSSRLCCLRALWATSCSCWSSWMRFCSSAILLSLTSTDCGSVATGTVALVALSCFLAPVSHMITIISTASPRISQDCRCFGRSPGGLGALSAIGSFIFFRSVALSFVRGSLAAPPKGDLLFPDDEISVIDDLGGDIDAVFQLEVEEVRLSVFDFVEGGFLAGAGLDVGKGLVVVDHGHTKRLVGGLLVQLIVKLQLLRVRSEEHTSELQSHSDLVCRLLLEKKNKKKYKNILDKI